MTFSVTPIIGQRFGEAIKAGEDAGGALGTVVTGNDGHDYILAKASADIASAAVCILTEPAMTMATGAGAWTAPTVTGGVPTGSSAWFKKTAI